MNRLQRDFLFGRPSFLSGAARVLDLFGVFDSYDQSNTPDEADFRAMYSDWRIVGQDIMHAAETLDPGESKAHPRAPRPKRRSFRN